MLEDAVDKSCIEYPDRVTIQESVSNTDNVIGSYTTVLLQAYFSGKNVILDDITFKKEYETLRELRFYFDDTNSTRLSMLNSSISDNCNQC